MHTTRRGLIFARWRQWFWYPEVEIFAGIRSFQDSCTITLIWGHKPRRPVRPMMPLNEHWRESLLRVNGAETCRIVYSNLFEASQGYP